jgi:N-glycosylase/DNA lyase
MSNYNTRAVAQLFADFASRQEAIRDRLTEFSTVAREEYFFELVYCLLTPQSSAVNAGRTVDALRAAGFPMESSGIETILGQRDHYIRFHNTKAVRLREAWQQYPEILLTLSNGHTGPELREWLAGNVRGLGWKESSHFLRNIGYRNLAILDRHILRNLRDHGVLRTVPETMTARQYLQIEQHFRSFADWVGISLDELDLLFWSRETGMILK